MIFFGCLSFWVDRGYTDHPRTTFVVVDPRSRLVHDESSKIVKLSRTQCLREDVSHHSFGFDVV